MAEIFMFRGGTPDFKAYHCEGDYARYMEPVDGPRMDATPPFNSHACGAFGQGWLNLHYPLVPNLFDTDAHKFMQDMLKEVKGVGDLLLTNWVPTRSYVDSIYFEVTKTDSLLDGVYITPVAVRGAWDFTENKTKYTEIAEHAAELQAAGITQFPLGTPKEGDVIYGMAKLNSDFTKLPPTFGHNIAKRDANTEQPTGPYDPAFGTVFLAYKITAGSTEAIKNIWKSNIEVYMSAKLVAFDGSSQIG
jgi:hypothetical protein